MKIFMSYAGVIILSLLMFGLLFYSFYIVISSPKKYDADNHLPDQHPSEKPEPSQKSKTNIVKIGEEHTGHKPSHPQKPKNRKRAA